MWIAELGSELKVKGIFSMIFNSLVGAVVSKL